MSGTWFSNRGQVIQVACAVAAVLIGLITQWDQISAKFNFLEIVKVLAYPAAALFLLNIGGRRTTPVSASAPIAPVPPDTKIVEELRQPKADFRYETPTVKVGTYYAVNQSFGMQRVTLLSIQRDESNGRDRLVAELEVTGSMVDIHCGNEVRKDGRTRFFVPASNMRIKFQDASIFEFVYREGSFDFVAICIDHINQPAQEVNLVVCVLGVNTR